MRNKTLLLTWLGVASFILVFSRQQTDATITILRDAGNLSRGTLPNGRLDPSSVTLFGPIVPISVGTDVIFSTNIAPGEIMASDTKRGVNGGILEDALSVIFSSHVAANSLDGRNDIQLGSIDNSTIKRGVENGIVELNTGVIFSSMTTGMMDLSGTTQTKNGGIVLNGNIRLTQLTKNTYRVDAATTVFDTDSDDNDPASIEEFRFTSSNEARILASLTEGGLYVGDSALPVRASSRLEVFQGSITVQSTNAGIRVDSLVDCDTIDTDSQGNFSCGSDDADKPIIIQDEGTDLSTVTVINFVGAGVTAANTGSTITVTIAGGGGGGDNQAVNTATITLQTDRFHVGGAVYLATSPFVAIPGKSYNTGGGTFNVRSIQGYTTVVSTALDGNVTMRIAQSTSAGVGFGAWSYVSSSATVISSSDTTNGAGGWRYGVVIATSFVMFPQMEYALHVTSVPTGGAPPAENFGINHRGWWSP